MIVPSPKSGEVSVSESTMESEGHVDVSGTSAGTGEYLQYLCEEDVKTLELCPFNTALAWRTMASFAQIFRDANLGGVVLPLVESLGKWHRCRCPAEWEFVETCGQTSLKMNKMRYDEIFQYLYLKLMQDVHAISCNHAISIWLLHLHQIVCSHSPLSSANGRP